MKLHAKQILAVLLAGAMSAACFTGCQQPSETPSSSKGETTTSSKAEEEKPKEITEVSWYISCDTTNQDEQKVFDKLNEYTEEKIGVRVKQNIFRNPDYNEKVPVMVNSGADFDICFTATWGNKFLPNVDKGAYLALDDLLPQYAKETQEAIPEMVWQAATVNGKIYAIPCYKEVGAQAGLMVNSDLAKKYGVDMSKVKTLEDLDPILATVKEKDPNVIGFTGANFTLNYAYEPLTGDSSLPVAAKVTGFNEFSDQTDLFNQYETKEFKDFCTLMNKWWKAGYTPQDPVQYDDDQAGRDADDKANRLFSWVISYSPGYKDTRAADVGHGVDYIPLRDPLYTGGGGFMAISVNSKHPDKALELLNLVNTDEYVATLIRHGIKDEHYKEVENNQVDPFATGFKADNHPYNYAFGWQFGNVFAQKWVNSYPADIVNQFETYNNSAKKVDHLGFTLDVAPVSTEIAALSGVINEYQKPLMKGMVDPEEQIPAFLQALKDNGAEKLMEEVKTQLTAWEAEQK